MKVLTQDVWSPRPDELATNRLFLYPYDIPINSRLAVLLNRTVMFKLDTISDENLTIFRELMIANLLTGGCAWFSTLPRKPRGVVVSDPMKNAPITKLSLYINPSSVEAGCIGWRNPSARLLTNVCNATPSAPQRLKKKGFPTASWWKHLDPGMLGY